MVLDVLDAEAGDRATWPAPTSVRDQSAVLILIVAAFLARWAFSATHAFWLDELTSVVIYGTGNPSGFAAVQRLAQTSIHPPLYQLILFYWMKLFGDGEVAARALSNLYMASATLCLYRLVRQTLGSRRALGAVILFSLTGMSVAYGFEARSYAQTLFLACLSSLLLFRWLGRLRGSGWRDLWLSRDAWLLVATNFLLLMTHYYNVFFLAAQGAFLLFHMMGRFRGHALGRAVSVVGAVGLLPLVLLLAIWWPVMVRSFNQFARDYAADAPTANPLRLFYDALIVPNVSYPLASTILAATLLLSGLVASRPSWHKIATLRGGFVVYVVAWALLPMVAAYTLFLVSGQERLEPRYFIFALPALVVLLVLAIEAPVALIQSRVPRLRAALRRFYVPYVFLVAVALLGPAAFAEATVPKSEWANVGRQIGALVRGDPAHRYLVYETTFRPYPTLNYYLRSIPGACVNGVIRLWDAGKRNVLKNEFRRIDQGDFLIVAFPHQRATQFEKVLGTLAARYQPAARLLDENGRGIVVFRITGENVVKDPALPPNSCYAAPPPQAAKGSAPGSKRRATE